MQLLNREENTYRSNIQRFIGEIAMVHSVDMENPYKGTIKLHGEVWGIQSDLPLQEKEKVIIHEVVGATFIVKRKGDN